MPSPRHAPRLTLVIIARDEAAQIGACLESARAVVDAMIVLDTGSRDETVAIAKAAGTVCAQAGRRLGAGQRAAQ